MDNLLPILLGDRDNRNVEKIQPMPGGFVISLQKRKILTGNTGASWVNGELDNVLC